MAITLVGSAVGTTTVTIPAHQAGDLIVIGAYRAGSATAPTLASGFTNWISAGLNSNSMRVGYLLATGSSHTSGTWTNAGRVICHVYRSSGGTLSAGTSNTGSGASGNGSYPALTLGSAANTTRWVAGFAGHRTSTSVGSVSGMSRRQTTAGSPITASDDTNGTVTSFAGGTAITWSVTNTGWMTAAVEVIETGSATIPSGTASGAWSFAGTAAGTSARPPLHTLVDTFSSQDTGKWEFNANASVSGGAVNLTTSTAYQGINSVGSYDLTGSSFTVELVQPTNVGNGTSDTLVLLWPTVYGDNVRWVWSAGGLYAQRTIGGTATTVASLTYSSTDHRWLRISESGGVVTWSTSPNGTSWTSRGTWTYSGITLTSVRASLHTGYWGTETSPGTAILDNVNNPPASIPVGQGTGAWSFGGSAAGRATRHGTASGAWSFTGSVIGDTPANRGAVTGTWTFTGVSLGSTPGAAPNPANLWKGPQQIDSFVAANPELATIADQPQAKWVNNGTDATNIPNWVTAAAGKTLLICIYAIPGRDSGGYSAGGFPDRQSYLDFLTTVKNNLGNAPVIIDYEPDALGLTPNMTTTARAERIETLRLGVGILAGIPNGEIYIDASMWIATSTQADLLRQVDVHLIEGFTLNTSAYNAQATCYTYGNDVVTALGALATPITGKKFIIDSGRNGNGPLTEADRPLASPWLDTNQAWCNPPKRALGPVPGPVSGQPNCRATLWIKQPGESDGSFPTTADSTYFGENAPAAGQFWRAHARDLLGLTPQPGGGTPTTGTISDVTADFETGWGSFTTRSPNVTLVGGRGRIPVTASYENILSAATYKLAGGTVAAALYPGTATGSTEASVMLAVNSATAGDRAIVWINAATNQIRFALETGYWDPANLTTTYNPTTDRWVRIRESGGTVYFDSSADGVTWTQRKSSTSPAWAANATTAVQVVTYLNGGSSTPAEVDNVNISAASSPVGTANGSSSFVGTATGVSIRRGSAAGTLAVGGLAVGKKATSGGGNGSWSTSSLATGRTVRSGTAVGTWSMSGTAVGRVSRSGSAMGTTTHVATASGTAPLVAMNSGAASGTVHHTGTGIGTTGRRGTASGAWSLTGSASGHTVRRGTGSGTITATGTASGTTARRSSSAGSWSTVGSAAGYRQPRGTSDAWTGAEPWTGTDPWPNQVVWSGTAVGSAPTVGVRDGSSSGSWSFTSTATGRSVRQGAASGTWGTTTAAAGQTGRSGSASGSWSVSGSAVGRTLRTATAAGSWAFNAVAGGWTTRIGAAVGTTNHASTAAGTAPLVGQQSGAATGTVHVTGTAVGQTTRRGPAAGAWQFVGTASGSITRSGTAGVSTTTWAGVAVGSRPARSTASGSWVISGSAAGSRPALATRSGSASGVWGFAGTAGSSPTSHYDIAVADGMVITDEVFETGTETVTTKATANIIGTTSADMQTLRRLVGTVSITTEAIGDLNSRQTDIPVTVSMTGNLRRVSQMEAEAVLPEITATGEALAVRRLTDVLERQTITRNAPRFAAASRAALQVPARSPVRSKRVFTALV